MYSAGKRGCIDLPHYVRSRTPLKCSFLNHRQYFYPQSLLLRNLSVSVCFEISGTCEDMSYSQKTVWGNLGSLWRSVVSLFFFFSCQRQEPTSGWLENTVSLWPGSQKCHFPHLSALLLWVYSVSAGSLQSGPPWPTSSQISNPKGQRVAFPNILANILKLSLARRGLLAHLWSTLWCQGMEYAADSLDLMLSLGSVGVEASVIPDPQTLSGSYLKHAFSARVISPPRN